MVIGLLTNCVPILKAETVAQLVREQEDVEITLEQVKTIMKDELGLGYRLTRRIPVQSNSERCLVLR